MTEEELFDQTYWVNLAAKIPDLVDDEEGVAHLVDRFVGQYLPVLLRVTRKEDPTPAIARSRRRLPSKLKGVVTTATTTAPISLAR